MCVCVREREREKWMRITTVVLIQCFSSLVMLEREREREREGLTMDADNYSGSDSVFLQIVACSECPKTSWGKKTMKRKTREKRNVLILWYFSVYFFQH